MTGAIIWTIYVLVGFGTGFAMRYGHHKGWWIIRQLGEAKVFYINEDVTMHDRLLNDMPPATVVGFFWPLFTVVFFVHIGFTCVDETARYLAKRFR